MKYSYNGHEAEIFGATDAGCVRHNNEDTFIAAEVLDGEAVILAVIDGMGGYEGGEVAAGIAQSVIRANVESASAVDDPLRIIHNALVDANNQIIARKEVDFRVAQMGCVVTAALFSLKDRRVYMAHCGDTRLYQLSDGKLTKLSRDHSAVGALEESGELTELEAMNHPRRNVISRYVGETMQRPDSEGFVDLKVYDLPAGETQLLLCSDGLSDMLTSDEIAEILLQDSSAQSKVEALISEAKKAGGKDNVTVILAQISAKEEGDADVHESNIKNSSVIPGAAEDEPEERKQRKHRVAPWVKNVMPWTIFFTVLAYISYIGIDYYKTATAPEVTEPPVTDTTTVIVAVGNELDSVRVDTVSRIVMQARDSMRVDIPRISSKHK